MDTPANATPESSEGANSADRNKAKRMQKIHVGARIDDRIHQFRKKRALRRGHVPVVVPYTGYGSPESIRVMCRILLAKPTKRGEKPLKKIRGWRSFTNVTADAAEVSILIDGDEHIAITDRGGLVDTTVPAHLAPGWHSIHIRCGNSVPVEASVFIVNPSSQFGLVSDVDDTVMVTSLPRPLLAAWNTFVRDEHARRPVPGMAVLYERLLHAHPGAPVFYLSTGAWNVAPTLSRFLKRHLYPSGPLLLTNWGPTPDRWFRSGRDHKKESLERLASEFPDLRWVLVGDDGQHDEELYRAFVESHPKSVHAVAIRQLSPGEAVLAGGRSGDDEKHDANAIPWVYAPHGAGLSEKLDDLGLFTS